MSFIAAVRFLTSIPLPGRHEMTAEQMGRGTAYFPVVGLIIGLILVALYWLLGMILPPAIVAALLVAAMVLLSGAMHLDGFADTCDGIGGHKPVEERWKVMRDSRTGAFGVVGVVVLLLVKYVTLSAIPDTFMAATLLFVPAAGRWAMVYAIFAFRYARPSGLGTAFKQATRWPQFVAATIITVAVALALFPFFSLAGLLVIGGVWVVITGFAFYLKYKFAGLTGDTYGAIDEAAEVLALLFFMVIYNHVTLI